MQLINTVAADLNLPTRVSPRYSRQSQGWWKGSTGPSLINFVQQGYNGAKTSKLNLICFLQSHFPGHFNTASSFSTTTSHTLQGGHHTLRKNYRYNYRPNIVDFGERVLGDIRNIPTQKLRLRSGRRKRGVRFKGGSRHEGFGVFEVKLLEPVISKF